MPTCAALGSSSSRGAGATVRRNGFARRSLAALIVLAGLAGAGGCDPQHLGNGVYGERAVRVGDFTGLRVQDGVGAVVTVAPGLTQSVTITGDANIVESNIHTSLEPDGVGSAAVTVLHLWASPSFVPVIPLKVVIQRPSLAVVRASGAAIELARGAGETALAGPLVVELERATLTARDYPVSAAAVELEERSTALLRSEGPVTGSVSADSRLDNTAGAGPCLVSTTAGASVSCN